MIQQAMKALAEHLQNVFDLDTPLFGNGSRGNKTTKTARQVFMFAVLDANLLKSYQELLDLITEMYGETIPLRSLYYALESLRDKALNERIVEMRMYNASKFFREFLGVPQYL